MINLDLRMTDKSGYDIHGFNEMVTTRLTGRHFITRTPSTPSKQNSRRAYKVCADKIKAISGKRGRKETSFYCK